MPDRRIRLALVSVIALLTVAFSTGLRAPAAFADSAQLTITNTAGAPDPAAGVPRVFTLSGATAAPESIYIKYRATGGEPCAPTAASDTGTDPWNGRYGSGYVGNANGSFSFTKAMTWRDPGTVLFCVWIAPRDDTVVTPITQIVTFRAPTGTISVTLSPTAPTPGQAVAITIAGASESPESVFAKYRTAGGAGCAADADADTGTTISDFSGTSVNGSFSLAGTETFDAGTYVLCAWLADSSSDPTPIAGPQATTFTVATAVVPPPDADGDGVTDSADLCAFASGPAPTGCPLLGGSITLKRSTSVYSGRLSGGSACRTGRKTYLKRKGHTTALGTATTKKNGSFAITLRRRVHGTLNVQVRAKITPQGICPALTSRAIKG